MNKTEVVQLVDCQEFEELFDLSWSSRGEVKRFEAQCRTQELRDSKFESKEKPPIYVGVVAVDRCFGGQEEGGWYYDWYQVEEILQCQDFRHLLSTVRSLREQYSSSRFGRYSAAGGRDHIIYMSRSKKLIEDIQSTERPRYE